MLTGKPEARNFANREFLALLFLTCAKSGETRVAFARKRDTTKWMGEKLCLTNCNVVPFVL